MISDSVKIAKINARAARDIKAMELLKVMATNPIVELVSLYLIVETLQRYPRNEPILGTISGLALEVAGTTAVGLQQIAPLMPAIAQGGSDIVKALPGLIAAAGA